MPLLQHIKKLAIAAVVAGLSVSAAQADSFYLSTGQPAYVQPAPYPYYAPSYGYSAPYPYTYPSTVFYNGFYEEPHHFHDYHRHWGYWEQRHPGMHHEGWEHGHEGWDHH